MDWRSTVDDIERMKRRAILLVLCIAAVSAAGCNWLVPLIFVGEHQRTVPAEFSKLAGKRTVVLVWAEPATLFDYPHIRLELSTYIAEKIRAGTEQSDVVDPTDVEDFVQQNLEAAIDPVLTGNHFGADYVVYVELLHFQIRDPSMPDLVQGRAQAPVSVYNLRADPDETDHFVLTPIEVSCPENTPLLMSSRTVLLVRQQTYEQLSEKIARKFYDHQVDL